LFSPAEFLLALKTALSSSRPATWWSADLSYDNNPNNVQVGELLPPNCSRTQGGCSGNATNDSTYPYVFNNALVDGSFGITPAIYLDQYTPAGLFVNSLEVPNSSQKGVPKDQLVTSFSSKSELALNLSLDGHYLKFRGYYAAVDTLDASNSNTPLEIDPTNPVGTSYYRATAQLDGHGKFRFTATNAYSGNNRRSAILNNTNGANLLNAAGNAEPRSSPHKRKPWWRKIPVLRRPLPVSMPLNWAISSTRSARILTSAA